tara:strand:- start:4 stop:270 length:267 start_codon:yes stop_codon:yes gene_type:complete
MGKPLYVGDPMYRVEYNALTFGVMGRITESGTILTATCRATEEDWESRRTISHRGHMLSIDSSKIIKIDIKSLNKYQKLAYDACLTKI